VGLKRSGLITTEQRKFGSNRTIVGLKLINTGGGSGGGGCSNRTIVGLKQRCEGKKCKSTEQAAIAPLWD